VAAFNRRRVAGSIIYKVGDDSTIIDIRRISIRPAEEGRGIASFLLRSTEVEGMRRFPGVVTARVDAKLSNRPMRAFLRHHGYVLTEVTDLYGLGAGLDAVYCKPLTPS
jgi:GNAT superfamily N-acetyltransferase